MGAWIVAAGALVLLGCQSGGAPLANAGSDQRVHWRSTVQLDGTASVDPEGDDLDYTWSMATRPAGSVATLTGADSPTPTFTPDAVGTYKLHLNVSDGDGEGSDRVTIEAVNEAPVARAGGDLSRPLGELFTLDGSASDDADGDPLSYAWTVTAGAVQVQPSTPTQAVTTFAPSTRGPYTLTLTVSDGAASSTDTVDLAVHGGGPMTLLDRVLIDAEYSAALDRIVAVTNEPPALLLVDPATGGEIAVPLPFDATAVSVSPSGTEAVVGHHARVTVVDLVARVPVVTHACSVDVLDVVHGGNGWAYVVDADNGFWPLVSVRLDTGAVVLGNRTVSGGTARRHPSRPALYLAAGALQVHDIGAGVSRFLRAGEFSASACGNLWFAADGTRVFTACADVFTSSADAAADLLRAGTIPGLGGQPFISTVAHSGLAARVALVLRGQVGQDSTQVRLHHDDAALTFAGRVLLPPVAVDGTLATTHGWQVFWRGDGQRLHVLVRTASADGTVRHAVWSTPTP